MSMNSQQDRPLPSLGHPAQDQSLSSEERLYAGNLSALFTSELKRHEEGFDRYAGADLRVPADIAFRVIINGQLHRMAMNAAHYLANGRVTDQQARELIAEMTDRMAQLVMTQLALSRETVARLDAGEGRAS